MSPKQLLGAAVLALVSLTGAMLEASLIHTDDGCVVETHCNACLLRLRTPGVVTVAFSLPQAMVVVGRVAPAPPPTFQDAAPKRIASRGPPLARTQ
jgi:hypothetical protein